ncbi:MAG: hypothetical protein FJ254_10305 [Phycisphaerae bacterium]|nr:hypothetical protein [Phycisphaerae bacterium]
MNSGTQAGNPDDGVVNDVGSIDILGFAMRHRSLIVLSTIVAALTTVGAYAIAQALPGTTTARFQITLTFKGAAKGQYPNEAPFSPQDLVGGDILEPLWKAQGLEGRIELADLSRSITISRTSRDLTLLESEYEQKLANAKLTASERQALEAEFKSKLDALAKTDFTITCSTDLLTPGEAERFVVAIPAEWARRSDAAGASVYDFPLPNPKQFRAATEQSTEGGGELRELMARGERLRDFTARLVLTLDELSRVPGSELLTDSTGDTIEDLRQTVNLIQQNLMMPAYVDAMALARNSSPAEYSAVIEVRRHMVEHAKAESTQRSEVLHDAIRRLSVDQSPRRTDHDGPDQQNERGIIANVDGTFIDRMIEQAVQNRDVEYRRELSVRAIAADLELADHAARVDFELWLERAVEERTEAGKLDVAETTKRLISLSNQIADLADRTREILVAVSRRNLNPASVLYQGDIAPVVTTERPVSTRNVAFAGVGFWFVLLGLSAVAGVVQDRRRALA